MQRLITILTLVVVGLLIVDLIERWGRWDDPRPAQGFISRWFDSRIAYRIGTIDPRFELSEAQIAQLTQEAIAIWEKPAGKALFVADPKAHLTINFIYDERQEQTRQQQHAVETLTQEQTAFESKQTDFERQRDRIVRERDDLSQRIAQWHSRLTLHNQRVNQSQGQLSQSEANALNAEGYEIKVELDRLNGYQDQLNREIQTLNDKANQLNQQADALNNQAQQYNRQFTPRQFEAGRYDGDTINIYAYESTPELRLIIAHELGHALGLGHIDAPTALMNPVLKEQNLENFELTAADRALLAKID